MQIKLTTDYAFRMLTYLSLKNNVANSKEIADRLSIPQKNILDIGRKLKTANHINIINGPYGGYKLKKKPDDISLYGIVSIFESVQENRRFKGKRETQNNIDVAMASLYFELQDMIEKKLKSKTLADLVLKYTVNSTE